MKLELSPSMKTKILSKGSATEEKGFTLIELLTTLSVISVLSAVALGQFQSYQSRALNARSEHDLRMVITAEHAYFAEHHIYLACEDKDCETALPAFTLSGGVKLVVTTAAGDESFLAEASHPRGNQLFRYDSSTGNYAPES